ncbi:hypothetical protein AKG98_465 [Moritella sp. JT01]|uniref:hypothetical protein n=1 Tax=Moritella sp. JT01 TaxID=756698 RepID=UPI00079625D2|nr:hypothetical protein [Moritella sp. JT01]KXO11555.1 hypothetical protein AKG98_465 [Moritella sp. JT01]
MVAVSKEESMLLIQHAISAYLNEGKNQKELGALLGIDGSRISEAKIGKWKLSPSQRQVIIDNYGYPRRGKGQYIKAEIYDTVTEFIDDYKESSKKRLKRRYYELLMRKDYQNLIVSELTSPKNPLCIQFDTESGSLVFDITIVEKLLSQPETKIWYDNYYSNAGYDHVAKKLSEKCYFSLVSRVQEDLIDELNPSFEKMLYRIAQFKFELMPEFSFFSDIDVHSIPRKELIITGDEVLNFKSDCSSVEFNNTADLLGPLEQERTFVSNAIPKGSEINEKPDNWECATLKLYLSESMRYHLWIRLDAFFHYDEPDLQETIMIKQLDGIIEDGLVRNIVIKDLCRMNFLKEIEIIRKWCGLPYDFNDGIKREVAKVGGYVPGAEVL